MSNTTNSDNALPDAPSSSPETTTSFTSAQLALIRKTAARRLSDLEFELFIDQCAQHGLNPMLKQIYAIVRTNKATGERSVAMIPTIQGLRAIADRTGRYRPDDRPARFQYGSTDPDTNPDGLVSAKATIFIRYGNETAWHKVEDEAFWVEYAPLRPVWDINPETGRREPTGKKQLIGSWAMMPRIMLSKCAEARALRRAFPEMAGLYIQEEIDQSVCRDEEQTGDQDTGDAQTSTELPSRLSKETEILFVFASDETYQPVRSSAISARLTAFYETVSSQKDLDWFLRANKSALQQYWQLDPNTALAMKRLQEAAVRRLQPRPERQTACSHGFDSDPATDHPPPPSASASTKSHSPRTAFEAKPGLSGISGKSNPKHTVDRWYQPTQPVKRRHTLLQRHRPFRLNSGTPQMRKRSAGWRR